MNKQNAPAEYIIGDVLWRSRVDELRTVITGSECNIEINQLKNIVENNTMNKVNEKVKL